MNVPHRNENSVSQIQMPQFYRTNNLISCTKEGPIKVPGLGRWVLLSDEKQGDISTKSHSGLCLDFHANKLNVKRHL